MSRSDNYSGRDLYSIHYHGPNEQECEHAIFVRGTCAEDAGTRALPMIDNMRGDRLAIVDKVEPYYLS